jgi:hypothetical protein
MIPLRTQPHVLPTHAGRSAVSCRRPGRRSRPGRGRSLGVRLGLALGLALGLGAVAAPAAQAAPATGQAYLIQGLVGETYDVVVDGTTISRATAAKSIVGPVDLAPGAHVVELVQAGSAVVSGRFTVTAGRSVDVVAHKQSDAARAPELTAFSNDTSAVGPGKLRLTVAHTAAAPPADITVDGAVLFSNVANAEALTLVVPAKTYSVAIVPAATAGEPILGPVDLPLKAGTLTRVFAIGDAATRNMDAVVHTLAVDVAGSGQPDSVRTGDGGQAATSFVPDRSGRSGRSTLAVVAAVLVGLGGAAATRRVAAGRRALG